MFFTKNSNINFGKLILSSNDCESKPYFYSIMLLSISIWISAANKPCKIEYSKKQ